MLKLPELISDLSEAGCMDTEAMEISTELMKIETLKEHLGHTLDETKLNKVLVATKDASTQEKATFSILAKLSYRERQCFIMHNVKNMSMKKIADELGIKKSTVQKYIERAKEKVSLGAA